MKLARKEKYNDLSIFIDKYWKKNHILAKNEPLFNFCYSRNKNFFNILLTFQNKSITSFLGFMPTSKYDLKLVKEDICFLALWFKKPGFNSLIVLKKYNELEKLKNWKAICVVGINSKIKKLYMHLGFKVGYLSHYFVKTEKKINFNKKIFLKKIKFYRNEKSKNIESNYYKTLTFMKNKYLKNSFYEYLVFSIEIDKTNSIFVARIIKNNAFNYSIFRIIDFSGPPNFLAEYKEYLIKIAQIYNCNYVDIFIGGEFNKFLFGKEFTKSSIKKFLPIYFEPLINEYKKIRIAYKKRDNYFKLVFYKGDGDYDRPNLI